MVVKVSVRLTVWFERNGVGGGGVRVLMNPILPVMVWYAANVEVLVWCIDCVVGMWYAGCVAVVVVVIACMGGIYLWCAQTTLFWFVVHYTAYHGT